MELTEFYDFINGIEGTIADPIIGRMKPIVENLIITSSTAESLRLRFCNIAD